MKIIIADDDEQARWVPMRDALRAEIPEAELIWCSNVTDAINALSSTNDIRLVSLDHDFGDVPYNEGQLRQLRTGLDITERLSEKPPEFRVLIHTSNLSAGLSMEQELCESGWDATYLVRSGRSPEEWLSDVWMAAVRQALG